MSFSTMRPERRSLGIAAAVLAAALPMSAVAVNYGGLAPVASATPVPSTGGAVINPAFTTQAAAEKDGYVPADEAAWRSFVYQEDGSEFDRVKELKVHSPSMDRDIPVVIIKAKENSATAPTIYLLNGADGGSGIANWLQQTSAIDFYGDQVGNVNVVVPMAGAFSYYTDWQVDHPTLDKDGNGNGGRQMWETFLTAELPGPMEAYLGTTSGKRAIVGMSMSASSVLVFGEHHPGLYDAIASYSGCAATSGTGSAAVDLVVQRGDATYEQMWGDRNGTVALDNDAQVNVAKLEDQKNIYISSSTGLMGEHDVPSGDRLRGNPIGSITPAVEGGPIEAAANVCTHSFKAAADKAGVTEAKNNITYNFRDTGTHQWGYWQDDMFASWPTLAAGFGFDVAEARKTAADAAAAYLRDNPGVGVAGSIPDLTAGFLDALEQDISAMEDDAPEQDTSAPEETDSDI